MISLLRNNSNAKPVPTALLKPLTPIAGTNLFLNLPYKWLDHTKPGCFAIYQDWDWTRMSYSAVCIVCNKADQKLYNNKAADWFFERTDGANSTDKYNGPLRIKNVEATHYVKIFSEKEWFLGLANLGVWNSWEADYLWTVRSDVNNKNHYRLEMQNRYMFEVAAPNHRVFLKMGTDVRSGFPYSFVPSVDLKANLFDFQFTKPLEEELAKHTSQKGLIDTYVVDNNSRGSLSRKITVSEKMTNEFSWGLHESMKVFSTVTGKVGVPFLAEGKVSAGFELNFAANQNWRSSEEKTFELSYDISVPPNSQLKISAWYDLVRGVSMDYTAMAEINGKISRVSNFDDIITDTPATGEMIRDHLFNSGFDGEIIEIKKESIIARIKGTMVASVGVRGRLTVNEVVVKSL